MENNTKVTSSLSSDVVGNCNDKANFPHKLLLTNIQFLTANIKCSKTELSQMFQPGKSFF